MGVVGRLVLVLLAALVAVVAGLAALVGAAVLTAQPSLFLLAGLVAFAVTFWLGLLPATRWIPPGRRRRGRAVLFGAVGAAVVVAFAGSVLSPMDDPRLPPAPVAGQRFWDLPAGSRIAYVRLPAAGNPRSTPVVVLHGGPGVPDMAGDAAYFGALGRDGFDVYVYDQLGSGRSSRLADPRGYGLARDVDDLEAIRRLIGADRLVLIGHSYGGALAAAYASAHPEHVAKLVLASPEDPSPTVGGTSMLFRLSGREKLDVYALLLPPRPLLAYSLLQVNPAAAHAFAGDAELDARQDRVYARTRPALHCRGKPPGPELHGLGFFANQVPQSASRRRRPDFLPGLAARPVPALLLKGRCDYLSWSSAEAYLRALPAAELVYLDGSGHNAYQDEPERFLAAVRAFLLDRPLPEPPYPGTGSPAGYEGPA